MTEFLNHWYDGWFYDFFIAPNQDKAFEKIKNFISESSSVLDAGCGTGRFCYQLNEMCSKIDGVDASEKNILIAKKNYDEKLHSKINFYHSDIKSFLENGKNKYDYAILSYVIHEINEKKRENILKLLSLYAVKIIIVDYISPHPKSITGLINRVVEFFAGKIHNRNFKSYLRNDGIIGLSKKTGLEIIDEIKNNPKTSHIAVFRKI
jgi:2-polyprenyl-3-methyl-5-hydroxy-6-metoxy-1,4-benzoquinol methylase